MESNNQALIDLLSSSGMDLSGVVDLVIAGPILLTLISVGIYALSVANNRADARRAKMVRMISESARTSYSRSNKAELLARMAPKTQVVGIRGAFLKGSEAVLRLLNFNRLETEKKLIQSGDRDLNAISVYIIKRGMGMVLGLFGTWFLLTPMLGMDGMLRIGLSIGAVFGGGIFVDAGLDRAVKSRRSRIAVELPVLLDLLTIYLEAGAGFDVALARGSNALRHSFPTASAEIGHLRAELEYTVDRTKTMREFAERLGTPVARTFVAIVLQAEQRGSAIAPALRTLARESRKQAMAEVERKAQKIPTMMQLPMFVFILPAIFAAVIGPAVIEAMTKFGY
jgi:tight adherence protein C